MHPYASCGGYNNNGRARVHRQRSEVRLVRPRLPAEEPQVIQAAWEVKPSRQFQLQPGAAGVATTEEVQPIGVSGPRDHWIVPWGGQGAARAELLPGAALRSPKSVGGDGAYLCLARRRRTLTIIMHGKMVMPPRAHPRPE